VRQPPVWILVIDGGTARIYRTTGAADAHQARLEPIPGGEFIRSDPAHFGPRPGKNFSGALRNSGHGVTTHEGGKRRAEEAFVESVLAWIERPDHLDAFQRLVVAAPARTLGEIRSSLSPALAERLHQELHGDLTKLPIKELEHRVMASLRDIGIERRQAS
jgi:protein required for attachment to host cells